MHRHTFANNVLLVGCGQVGTELGQRLVGGGTRVFALRRNPIGLPTSFQSLAVDLTRPVNQPLPKVQAMVVTLTPTIPDVGARPGYLVAIEHLAKALPEVPERVIFVSSTRVFEGRTETRPLTEADDVAPVTQRGEILVAGEQLATELFDAHIVRPAGIYGPGREMLIRKVLEHQPVQYGRRTNRIHQTDLVGTLHAMLTLGTAPRLLHAIDQTPGVELGDVVDYIATRLEVTPPPAQEPREHTGRVLSGELLQSVIGALQYPTYREGYDHILATSLPAQPDEM